MHVPLNSRTKTMKTLRAHILILITAFITLLVLATSALAAPAAPTITGGPQGSVNATSFTFTYTGPTTSGGQMQCSLDSISAFSPCTGPTSHTLASVPEGKHRFYVREHGTDGNSAFVYREFNADRTAPQPPSITVKPATTQKAEKSGTVTATFNVTAREPFDGVDGMQCALDGAWEDCPTANKVYNVSAGAHTFMAREMDAAGNWSEPASYAWTVLPYDSTTTPGPSPAPGPVGGPTGNVCKGTVTKLYWQKEKRKSMRHKLKIKGSTARAVKGVRVVIRGQVTGCSAGQEMEVYHIVKGKRLHKTGVKVRADGKFTTFMPINAKSRSVSVVGANTKNLRFVRVRAHRV
jgi:hypothetical protein